MVTLFKAYGNYNYKFNSSAMDYFEQKFMLFIERCVQTDAPVDEQHLAFFKLLVGHACQYYFDDLKRQILDLNVLAAVKSRFTTLECTKALLREWRSLSLRKILRL